MPRDDTLLHPGDPAPDFWLPAADGTLYSPAQQWQQGRRVALFFFRGTWCGTCQRQMALLRDHYPALTAQGWAVIGITVQAPQPVAEYARERHIPFPVLIDADRAVSRQYGVYTSFSMQGLEAPTINRPHNSTFLISSAGIIRLVHVSTRSTDVLDEPGLLAALAAVPGQSSVVSRQSIADSR